MTQILAISKAGKNVLTATDPNDFIFHSSYNTFKIVLEATVTDELAAATPNQTITVAHGLTFTPLINAMARDTIKPLQYFPPNSRNIDFFSLTRHVIFSDITFNYAKADATNIYFNFDNDNASVKDVTVKYYCLEQI